MSSVSRNFINPQRISSTPVYLITVGFVSILGQVVILRELDVAFYGVELIYILSLGLWLLGTAIGAAFGRRIYVPRERNVQILFLLTAAVLMIEIVFIRGVRKIFGGVSGGFLPFHLQIIGMTLAILPSSFLAGVLFQWAAKRFLLENRTLAEAYSLESAGGVLGGLSSTLLLTFGLQNLSAGLICAACSTGVVSFYSWRENSLLQRFLSVGGLALVLVLFAANNRIDRWMTSWNHPYLIESRDTPYGRVTVTSLEEQMSVFENDALSYESETTAAEEFVQLSTLEATKLEKVLVLGGGFEGIVSELLKLPVNEIDYVEINERLVQVVRDRLPPELRNSLSDEKVKIIYKDPRQFLDHSSSYDVILVVMPEPTSAQNNRFYTREFFEQCSDRLNQDGVVAFRIPSAENLWTRELQNRNRSIYDALRSAFGDVVVIPGVTNIFIASKSPLTTNPAILIDRFRIRNIKTSLVTPEYINYVFTNDRFGEIERLLSAGTPAPNSDIHPACYGYTISIWLSKFLGEFTLPDSSSFHVVGLVTSPIFWLIVVGASVIALTKRLFTARRFVLMFLAGLAGMVSESLLLLYYQSKNGALYQDIGILLMSFMAGLALGASIVNQLIKGSRSGNRRWAWLGVLLILGFGMLNVAVYYTIKSGSLNSLFSTSLMLALDGVFVSAIFALISLDKPEDRKKAMMWLYSADLIGGCAGSLTASLILLPVFGILTTLLLTAAVAVCALAFLK
jgi:spermidine synthase